MKVAVTCVGAVLIAALPPALPMEWPLHLDRWVQLRQHYGTKNVSKEMHLKHHGAGVYYVCRAPLRQYHGRSPGAPKRGVDALSH